MSEQQENYLCSLSAQDLRIDNWVYDGERTQFPMQVTAIGKDWVHLDFPGNEGDIWEADIKDLRPIELTEELFKKNGFTLQEDLDYYGNYFMSEDMRMDVYESSNGWVVHIDDKECSTVFSKCLKYVHEMQNAYYLATGEELEVQP